MACEPVCVLRDAVKSYRGVRVLGPVTVELRPGELTGVRGPNGAGKSTLLSLLSGAVRPDSGKLLRSGEAEKRTAWVPQELSLYGSLTCRENLMFWAAAQGLPRRAADARIRWLADRLALSDRLRDPAVTLSGGMKRRLHLATALVTTPALLLLDEPTVGADPESAELILDLVRHMRDTGSSVVLVSHRAGELDSVCDRVIDLEGGVIKNEITVFTGEAKA